jgi:CHAT domain-containing protein
MIDKSTLLSKILFLLTISILWGQNVYSQNNKKKDYFITQCQKHNLSTNEISEVRTILEDSNSEETLLKYFKSKKLYSPSELESALHFFVLEEINEIVNKNKYLPLNKYDTLYLEAFNYSTSYLISQKKSELLLELTINNLIPELIINGHENQKFIGYLIFIGREGLKQHRRVNDYQVFLGFAGSFLERFEGTQFYIDSHYQLAKIYFDKDVLPYLYFSGNKIYEQIRHNSELRSIHNLNILREISYFYLNNEVSNSLGGLMLLNSLHYYLNSNEVNQNQDEIQLFLNNIILDQIHLSIFTKTELKNRLVIDECIASTKTSSKTSEFQEIRNKSNILLFKLFEKEEDINAMDSLFSIIKKVKSKDLKTLYEKQSIIVRYLRMKGEKNRALNEVNYFLSRVSPKSGFYRKKFESLKIELLIELGLKEEAFDIMMEEVYQQTYSYINNNQAYSDYTKPGLKISTISEISFFVRQLFKMDSINGNERNRCISMAYYYLHNYINTIKGSIANSIQITEFLNDSTSDIKENILGYQSRMKILEEINNLKSIETYDSLKFDLDMIDSKIREVNNQFIHTHAEPVIVDSTLNKVKLNTLYVNALMLTPISDTINEYLVFSQIKLDTVSFSFLLANIIKVHKNEKNPMQLIWDKIIPKKIKFENIFFSLDGDLLGHNMNLVKDSLGDFVIKKFNIRHLSSPKSFLTLDSSTNNNTDFVFFGNPSFVTKDNKKESTKSKSNFDYLEESTRSVGGINQLPYSEVEIHNIEKILIKNKKTTHKFLKSEASETNLKEIVNPRLLHIATHGYFIPEQNLEKSDGSRLLGFGSFLMKREPLIRSGLLFANVETHLKHNDISKLNANDGVFTAYEAKELNLQNTELIVLSACETGLGKISNGEGVYGLQRAFLLAGAKAILMSLTKVPDEATQYLMTKFYYNWIEKGMQKHEALREVQVEMLKSEKYSNPINWAGFYLIE